MSEPLKGGFSSFSSGTPFKLPGTTGAAPSTGLFGNTAPAANAGTTAQGSSTPSMFAGGGNSNLFGNSAAKPPATGTLFSGATPGTASTSNTATGGGSNMFSGFGTGSGTSSPAQTTSTTTNATSAPSFGGGMFGAKPAEQATNGRSSTTPQPSGTSFGVPSGNTAAAQPTSTAPNFFSKSAEIGSSTSEPATTATGGSSLFGANLFGKKPDTPAPATSDTTAASNTPAASSLFGNFGKKDESTDKEKEKDGSAGASASLAAGTAFGQAATNKDAPTGQSGSAFSLFGQKPAEKKDTPADGEKKDGTAASAASLGATNSGKPAGTNSPTPSGISVSPPSMLRGKTIEEIVNKWSSELETHVREFNRLAGEVAVWDRALIDNGNTIAALFQHVLMAEREQSDIEQSLKHVEDQQKELASTLEVYEKAAGEIFDPQSGGLRALDVGPADAERDKHYTLAAELNTNLDDLSRSLLQMIESVNALSEPSENGAGGDGGGGTIKGDAPLEQIAQILSSHLESLQWIDSAVKEVDSKVTDVERLVRDASGNGSRNSGTASSLAGSVDGARTNGMRGSRGFGVR